VVGVNVRSCCQRAASGITCSGAVVCVFFWVKAGLVLGASSSVACQVNSVNMRAASRTWGGRVGWGISCDSIEQQ
jgi:hypothetical protein